MTTLGTDIFACYSTSSGEKCTNSAERTVTVAYRISHIRMYNANRASYRYPKLVSRFR